MRNPVDVEEQYLTAIGDELKILVVGAGIAGITVTQLLRRDGRHPILIERAEDEGHPGYMLALMPLVDTVLDDLGVRRAYLDNSTPLGRFGFHARTGKMLRTDSTAAVLDQFGDYRGISRGELMKVLTTDECDVAYNTSVTALDDSPECTTATFATPSGTVQLDFDLVIVADGIHSTTRELVIGERPLDVVDTNWGGWVVWAPADGDADLGEELWGTGFFLGVYPVKGQLGVFVGGPSADLQASPEVFIEGIRRRLKVVSPRLDSVLRAVLDDPNPYYWPLSDCRAPVWAVGRAVLVGDAAAGFLPTAGVGAGMAMESAWVLARMLRYAKPGNVALLLRSYEQSQRPRVEAAQNTSRSLAGLMFRRSKTLAVLRDLAMRVISIQMALKPIQRLLREKPDPDVAAIAATRPAADLRR